MQSITAKALMKQFGGFHDFGPCEPTTTDAIIADLGFGAHEWITEENFPLAGRILEKTRIGIIDPGRDFDEEEISSILAPYGLVKPDYRQALSFAWQIGEKIPQSRKKPYIIFPHEPWMDLRTRPRMLALCRDPGGRRLCLAYPSNGFDKCAVIAGIWPGNREASIFV